MLTILSPAGGTAPPRPWSRQVALPGSPRSGTLRSIWTAATVPPATRPPLDSGLCART